MKYIGRSYEELCPFEEANFGEKWKISFFCTVSAQWWFVLLLHLGAHQKGPCLMSLMSPRIYVHLAYIDEHMPN